MYNNNNYNNREMPKMNMGNYRYLNIPKKITTSVETRNNSNYNYNSGNNINLNAAYSSYEKQTNGTFFSPPSEMFSMQAVQQNTLSTNRVHVEQISPNTIPQIPHSNANKYVPNVHNNYSSNAPLQQSTSVFTMPTLDKQLQGVALETPSLKRKYVPTPQISGNPPLNSTISKLNESTFESKGNVTKRVRTNKNGENNPSTSMKIKASLPRVFTGTVEKAIKWNKVYKEDFCFYEVIASLVSIQEGTVKMQKILLVRDKKGPIMQVIYYETDHIHIENFVSGQMLRCVGRMVGPNILHAISIREAKDEEVSCLLRMCYICDHAIQRVLAEMPDN